MQKYRTLRLYISAHLIIISLRMKYLIQGQKSGLVKKSDISGFIDNSNLDKKIATLATKAELKSEQDKIIELVYKQFKIVANTNKVSA